jgi:hypothetical protein
MSETKEKKRKSSDDDDKKERKRAKSAEKHKLKEQLPKTDENGIAYTKLQVRKMLKRVKRGMYPIPTKQEEQELKRQEAETRKEEEAEFAGLADSLVSEKKEEDSQDSDDEKDEDTRAREHGEGSTDQSFSKHDETTTTRKRKKRSKPVPDDYVCQACKNEHEPKHWIYDCPNKVTVKGTNHISKKLRGIHSPDNRKVFVSGLSFDMRKRDVELLFQDCGTIVHCKLLTFPDTGRCKGQAYVTFEDESSAKKALQLSGTVLPSDDVESKSLKSKKKKTESSAKQKELKLKVTKVLNRIQTKHKSA